MQADSYDVVIKTSPIDVYRYQAGKVYLMMIKGDYLLLECVMAYDGYFGFELISEY